MLAGKTSGLRKSADIWHFLIHSQETVPITAVSNLFVKDWQGLQAFYGWKLLH